MNSSLSAMEIGNLLLDFATIRRYNTHIESKNIQKVGTRMEATALISKMTKTLGGRIRIVQVEKIENATGLSTRYNALEAMQDPIVAELTRAITETPNRYSPRPTDNGLRFCAEWMHCTWYVYSY